MRFFSLALGLLVLAGPAVARAEGGVGEDCRFLNGHAASTWVSRFFTVANGCLLQVTPQNKPDLSYREYFFDQRGRFLVFNSRPGPFETSTSTRSYFFFPRRRVPSFSIDGSNVWVELPNGGSLVVDGETSRIKDLPGAEWEETFPDQLQEGGGVEIRRYPGLLLDAGYQVGGYRYHDPLGKSLFRDAKGGECQLFNAQLFDYQNPIYGEPVFLFQSDAELATFLEGQCPGLDTFPLL